MMPLSLSDSIPINKLMKDFSPTDQLTFHSYPQHGSVLDIFQSRQKEAIGLSKLQEWYFSSEPTEMIYDTLLGGSNSWAGDRIICLGDGSSAEHVPVRIFSDDEWESFNIKEEDVIYYQLSERCSGFNGPHHYYKIEDDFSNYVLRNLSEKEYMRGDNAPRPLHDDSSLGRALFTCICCSEPQSGLDYMEIEGFGYIEQGM
ncbi:hypothetical protein BDQ17DRAFT_858104 [Cyathus striatus]|nr:hypothetical protein BDQ17DRAFT_858104 [Cyathus striatus]